jgi:ribosomal-protein-alanine N-acetyltransferase
MIHSSETGSLFTRIKRFASEILPHAGSHKNVDHDFAQYERDFAQGERDFAQYESDFTHFEMDFAYPDHCSAHNDREFAHCEGCNPRPVPGKNTVNKSSVTSLPHSNAPQSAARTASTGLRLVDASSAHLNTLLNLEKRSFTRPEDRPWTKEEFQRYFNIVDPLSLHATIAMAGATPIGYVLLRISQKNPAEANIDALAVVPEARGRKVGQTLMLHALDEAVDCGVEDCTLQVEETNNRAWHLYDKLGFHNEKLLRGYYGGRHDAIQMKLSDLQDNGVQEKLKHLEENS